ncbi:hypothetical protein DPEC_G00352510 [Dallia pectoralis]|uniref:Uncharacterized protein n=1 Tax=Dallia pectoralis TaxID=75939 RepID=A0ACC2F298_DALPE|nr:hypothetical protein DPEC_G00352510 [Dallia pectoralis]
MKPPVTEKHVTTTNYFYSPCQCLGLGFATGQSNLIAHYAATGRTESEATAKGYVPLFQKDKNIKLKVTPLTDPRAETRQNKESRLEEMEDKQGELLLQSRLAQPHSNESETAQSGQPDSPPLWRFNQEKHIPEQTVLKEPTHAKCNPLQTPDGPQHPVTLLTEIPSQAQPEQLNVIHEYQTQTPIDDPHLAQSEDRPHPDQGSTTILSLDQSSPQRTSPDKSSLSSPDQSSLSSSDEDKPKKKGDPNKLSLLTWNIDGLDMSNTKERLSKLLDYLIEYHPDIVLLQEVIPPIYQVLQQVLKPYHVLPGCDKGYFTAILLRKSRVRLVESRIIHFPTNMGRNLLVADVSFLGHPLCVITSHMDSMKGSSMMRQTQLIKLFSTMRKQAQDHIVIFGGDTNLRDWELKNVGGLPEGTCDVWESLGEPEYCRYTWDCVTNDNNGIAFPARLRFDRLFLRQAGEGSKFIPDGMTLVGLNRLDECDRFTSDHWGLLCTFVIEPVSQPSHTSETET